LNPLNLLIWIKQKNHGAIDSLKIIEDFYYAGSGTTYRYLHRARLLALKGKLVRISRRVYKWVGRTPSWG